MKTLFVLGTLAVLIAAQNTQTVVFPPNGNGSSSEMGSKIEPALQPDMTRGVAPASLVPPQPQPMLPSDYFFPGKDFSIFVTLRRRRLITYPLCMAIIKLNICCASIIVLTLQSRKIIIEVCSRCLIKMKK